MSPLGSFSEIAVAALVADKRWEEATKRRVCRFAQASRSRSRAAVPSKRSRVSYVPFSISARMARVRAILKLDFSAALAKALAVGEISTMSIAELNGRVGGDESRGTSTGK